MHVRLQSFTGDKTRSQAVSVLQEGSMVIPCVMGIDIPPYQGWEKGIHTRTCLLEKGW